MNPGVGVAFLRSRSALLPAPTSTVPLRLPYLLCFCILGPVTLRLSRVSDDALSLSHDANYA